MAVGSGSVGVDGGGGGDIGFDGVGQNCCCWRAISGGWGVLVLVLISIVWDRTVGVGVRLGGVGGVGNGRGGVGGGVSWWLGGEGVWALTYRRRVGVRCCARVGRYGSCWWEWWWMARRRGVGVWELVGVILASSGSWGRCCCFGCVGVGGGGGGRSGVGVAVEVGVVVGVGLTPNCNRKKVITRSHLGHLG